MGKKLFLFMTVAASTTVWAMEEESFSGFEALVSELEMAAKEIPPPSPAIDWEEVAVHAGVGFTMATTRIETEGLSFRGGVLKGFEAHFGVNMFSREARLEGIFRNYAREELSNALTADLKEFEFRGIYLPAMNDKLKLRFGFGLAARYMDISAGTGAERRSEKASTPFSSFLVGFERKITPAVSVGPDLSYRSALTSETFDKSAWDATLKLNATF